MNSSFSVYTFFFLFLIGSTLLVNTGCGPKHKGNITLPQQDTSEDLTKNFNPEKAAKFNLELGLAYLESHQPARGKIKLQRALELAPFLPEVHLAFGRYYESIDETDEAEKSYLKALKLNKNWAVSQNLYGAFLCRQAKYDKANRAFEIALQDKTYPESASILENAGLCALEAGKKNKAKAYFEKAVRQDIHRANSLLELAYMHYEEKNSSVAWQLYNQYLMVANQTPRSLYLGVKLARIFHYQDKEASYLLLLKNEYADSPEYKKL